ncbi:PASTA domain-containing protein [Streptomyces sp. NPDC048057]|uniref:PASTA domain-containing protein n=1 Tax=Streptomyces sp. NPDC048057 TaxID=3155628 RepID=UPI00340B1D23
MTWGGQSQQAPWGGQAPKPQGPGWARKRFVVPGAAVLFFMGVGIGASGGGDEGEKGGRAAPGPTVTVTPRGGAAPAPAVTATVTAAPAKTPRTTAGVAHAGGDSGATPVPNFVGMGLQAAQDAAQDVGFSMLTSHDSTGERRNQLWDRNWKVCTQEPAAGKKVPKDTELNFGTVKNEERCP